MPLTDAELRSLKPESNTRRYFDERGLYLEIPPSGGKWWRFKYRFMGREKRLSLGVYPDVPLKTARSRRDDARKLLADGIDPGEHRKAKRLAANDGAGNSFEVVAREWYQRQQATWAESHKVTVITRLQNNVFPFIGTRTIGQITAPELLAVMRRIEKRTIETAHRVLRICGQIFRYGIATGRCERDPAADLRGALALVPTKHLAATTDPKRLGEILRAADDYPGTLVVATALWLAPRVFVRPGELRHMQWTDVDLSKAEWRYYVTKTKTWHIVPLSKQAMAKLRDLHKITGGGKYALPNPRSKQRPMSENAVNYALRSLDIGKDEMCGHGFRAVARTLLDEVLGFRPDIIEHQLAHTVRDPLGRAYNRTAHLKERKAMMQRWTDYLEEIKKPAGKKRAR